MSNPTPAPLSPEREAEIPAAHRMTLKGVLANALGEQSQVEGLLDGATAAVVDALTELGYGALRDAEAERPSRFSASPAEVDHYLRTILAEDVYLSYQQAIGRKVSSEAADDIRNEVKINDPESPANETWLTAADVIDASDMGGPYPSELVRFNSKGGA